MTAKQKHTPIVEAEAIEVPTPTARILVPLELDVETSQQGRNDLVNLADWVREVF